MEVEFIDWRDAVEYGLWIMLRNGTRPEELGPRHIGKYIESTVDFDYDPFDAEVEQFYRDVFDAWK